MSLKTDLIQNNWTTLMNNYYRKTSSWLYQFLSVRSALQKLLVSCAELVLVLSL